MLKRFLPTALLATITLLAFGQNTAQRQKHFHLEGQHLALEGYDPVSYFQGMPLKGKKELNYEHLGVAYRFSSTANRDAFRANPSKYEPAYGGWCAYAMAEKGEKVEVDPLTYRIADGRLLLFYNKFFTNTLESWQASKTIERERLVKADRAWKGILGK